MFFAAQGFKRVPKPRYLRSFWMFLVLLRLALAFELSSAQSHGIYEVFSKSVVFAAFRAPRPKSTSIFTQFLQCCDMFFLICESNAIYTVLCLDANGNKSFKAVPVRSKSSSFPDPKLLFNFPVALTIFSTPRIPPKRPLSHQAQGFCYFSRFAVFGIGRGAKAARSAGEIAFFWLDFTKPASGAPPRR